MPLDGIAAIAAGASGPDGATAAMLSTIDLIPAAAPWTDQSHG